MRSKFNWGTGMAVLFSMFVVFILGMVLYSATRSYHLVEKDYYNEELDYQSRIEQLERTREDPDRLVWSYNKKSNSVIFRYNGGLQDSAAGEIHFYRPSDSDLDFRIPVQLNNEGVMVVNAEDLQKGIWKVKALFTATGVEYYKEDRLIIE